MVRDDPWYPWSWQSPARDGRPNVNKVPVDISRVPLDLDPKRAESSRRALTFIPHTGGFCMTFPFCPKEPNHAADILHWSEQFSDGWFMPICGMFPLYSPGNFARPWMRISWHDRRWLSGLNVYHPGKVTGSNPGSAGHFGGGWEIPIPRLVSTSHLVFATAGFRSMVAGSSFRAVW